jgi:hypothetical protein
MGRDPVPFPNGSGVAVCRRGSLDVDDAVFWGGIMKRVLAAVEITRRTSVEFEVDDDADTEDIKATALEEAELAEWDDDPPDVVSIQIIEPS